LDFGTLKPFLPDLVVCLAWVGDIPYIYQDQRVKVRVKNIGLVGAPASTFKIYVKGHGDQLVQVPALAPQSEYYWSKKYDWKTCGHKTVRATADPDGQIAESNENNNMLQNSIKVSCGETGFLLEMNRCSDQN
jgi:subtilase family serine protease